MKLSRVGRTHAPRLALVLEHAVVLDRRHGVGAGEPAPEVDVAAARGAERAVLVNPRPAAGRAARSAALLAKSGLTIQDLRTTEADLEDLFLRLTSHEVRKNDANASNHA